MALMIALGTIGIVLILGAPALVRLTNQRFGDAVPLTRMIQVVGIVFLLLAILLRPHSDETAAFPPPEVRESR